MSGTETPHLDAALRCLPPSIGPYLLKSGLGQGAFSIVQLAVDSLSGEQFACKITSKQSLAAASLVSRFESEVRILQHLSHPSVIRVHDFLEDPLRYYLVLEYCPNGELYDYIIERRFLPESEAVTIAHQLAAALGHLHALGFAHRDLKPENILRDARGRVKLSDFGFAVRSGPSNLVSTPCGSMCYTAPESLIRTPHDARTSDVWSFGVILYVMVVGALPWTSVNPIQLGKQITTGDFTIPNFVGAECRDLISKAMTVDPAERIDIECVMRHPWLQKVSPYSGLEVVPSRLTLRKLDRAFKKDDSIFGPFPIVPKSRSEHFSSFEKVGRALNIGRTRSKGKHSRRVALGESVRQAISSNALVLAPKPRPPLVSLMASAPIHGIFKTVTFPKGRSRWVPRLATIPQFSGKTS